MRFEKYRAIPDSFLCLGQHRKNLKAMTLTIPDVQRDIYTCGSGFSCPED